jgi:hypothetical protein
MYIAKLISLALFALGSMWLFEYSVSHEKELIRYVREARGQRRSQWRAIQATLKAFRLITFGISAAASIYIIYLLLNHHL